MTVGGMGGPSGTASAVRVGESLCGVTDGTTGCELSGVMTAELRVVPPTRVGRSYTGEATGSMLARVGRLSQDRMGPDDWFLGVSPVRTAFCWCHSSGRPDAGRGEVGTIRELPVLLVDGSLPGSIGVVPVDRASESLPGVVDWAASWGSCEVIAGELATASAGLVRELHVGVIDKPPVG